MDSQTPSDSGTKERQDEAKEKLIDRLSIFWMHQNELLWGRLQTIAVIQAGVLAGWYYLTFSDNGIFAPFLAFCLTSLGFILSREVKELIECDLDHRRYHSDMLKELDKNLFLKREGTHGWKRIKFISGLFVWINGFLAVVSGGNFIFRVLVWLFRTCGC